MSERSKKIITVVAAILIVATAIGATICMVKHKKTDSVETTTESTTVTTTATKATYTVNLEYVQRMLDKKVFTDKFETYTAETFATPNEASKEAYWRGIQEGNTVNPLLLAATSSYLNELGFDTPNIKPSELYDEPEDGSNIAKVNKKGEETLNAVKKIIFSDDVRISTSNLGSSAKAYYNSTPSKEDGIVYASKIGITGNTACWIIAIQKEVSVDDAYADIVASNKAKASDGKKSAEVTTKNTETKQLVQLCRCGNTVDKKPKKPTQPTTRPTTTQPTTKPTTKPTTRPTTQPTTKPTTQPTTQPYTKNQQKDPVNQGNADRGGGSKRFEEDKTATSRYQPEEPTMPSSVRKVTTTKAPTTTAPTTTKAPSTTKAPTTTKPTTAPPKAEPTHVESNTYVDKDTGKTTVVNDEVVVTGAITRPKR